jgi:hypothetical protein
MDQSKRAMCNKGPTWKKIFVPDPPPLIKERILRGARKRPGAVDRSACMIAVQISALFILDSGPPPSR